MAYKALVLPLSILAAASPVSASVQDQGSGAPDGTSETQYCMRVEAVTGTRIKEVKCWTRAEWADRGVDVDVDWAKEGVRTIG